MRRQHVIFGIGALLFVSALLVGQVAAQKWREHYVTKREREWIWTTAQRLAALAPPPPELQYGAVTGHWIAPGYLLFINGWAGYDIHPTHACDGMGDLALFRSSNRGFYLSKLHFCCGIADWMIPPSPETPRPADLADFLIHCGKLQEWTLFSPDGQLGCIVSSPHPVRNSKKTLHIWIGRAEGPSQATLFEGRYSVPGFFVFWKTGWAPEGRVAVDVFDYSGRRPQDIPEDQLDSLSNHITTLIFHRDLHTGRFTEEK